jgi:hypothetical protein
MKRRASWANYVSTGSRLHFQTLEPQFTGMATSNTFPGIAALALVVIALSERRRGRPAVPMCVAAAAVAPRCQFAPLLPFVPLAARGHPLFQAVRVLAHIGQLVLLMVAILAGYGVAVLQRGWHHQRSWPLAAAMLLVIVIGEALRAPIGYTWFEGVPKRLRRACQGAGRRSSPKRRSHSAAVVPERALHGERTRHWQPILNGYSGFGRRRTNGSYEAMRTFPSDESLLALSSSA